MSKSVYIAGLDAKDIHIANMLSPDRGYDYRDSNGRLNTRRFLCSLDYSLDQIKLREIYEKVCRRTDFSFRINRKWYCTQVINVTFKYSVCEFNQCGTNRFVKYGHNGRNLAFEDCVCLYNGELIGIQLDMPVANPISPDLLGRYFKFENGVYKKARSPKTLIKTSALRKQLYDNGFMAGGIHYVRWKRSAGSSRVGKCLFINERLYDRMHRWEMCGIHVKEGDTIDLAALESYISLTSSSIIDTLELEPKNILVIDDAESCFTEPQFSVSVFEKNGKLQAEKADCQIKNSIWDGQGFIDREAMGKYRDRGMILLRNKFFKSCCFNCNLQQFFADHGITEVSQLNGYTQAERVEDIKLVVTRSSIKYFKFGTLEQWLANLEFIYGIVKHEKPTHFFGGQMVQTHYQLLNTIQMTESDVWQFLKPTFDYVELLKTNPAVLRHHIKYPIVGDEVELSPLQTKNDVIWKLMGITDKFTETRLYNEFKNEIIRAYLKNVRLGHVLVNGNYSTMVGNPLEMLYAIIGQFDGQSMLGVGNIHTKCFEYGKTLIGSRSPHVSMSNVWLPRNVECEELDRYLNMTNEIVAVNSIGESTLDKLSGCDFDSDTVLLTDNEFLIKAAQKWYGKFPIALNNVAAVKTKRAYTNEQKAELDIKTGNNLIGDIINLSQELNTRIWDELNSGASFDEVFGIYLDVCKLNIMSCLEIDSAKKEFNISNSKELAELRRKYELLDDAGKKIKPNFFAAKDKGKGYYVPHKKNYKRHDTTMDYLEHCVNRFALQLSRKFNRKNYTLFSAILTLTEYDRNCASKYAVRRCVSIVRGMLDAIKSVYSSNLDNQDKFKLYSDMRQDCNEYIGRMKFNPDTMIYFLKTIEGERYKNIYNTIFYTLFGYPNTMFYEVVLNSANPIRNLISAEDGDIVLYGKRYKEEIL